MALIPQKVLFSLGGSFLYYADRFKIYSAFCASHTKVPKVLAKGKKSYGLLREELIRKISSCSGSRRSPETFLLLQRKPTPISRPSWLRETPDSSIRPPWSRTWSNPSREFWSTLCCWRSSTPSPTLTARSTTTWTVNTLAALLGRSWPERGGSWWFHGLV